MAQTDRKRSKIFIIGLTLMGVLFAALFILGALSQISTRVTPQDKAALERMYAANGTPVLGQEEKAGTFEGQITQIRAVQEAVLKASPILQKIPAGTPREPENLLEAGHGQCSDRARSILKGLQAMGYDVRFAAIYSFDQSFMPPEQLARKVDDVRSHALVEVLTSKGWLFVDTNEPWISLDQNGEAVSLAKWQKIKDRADFEWSKSNKGQIYWLMKSQDLMVIYGLYSRHGLFYPPYTPYIPDIDWRELIQTRLF